MNKRLVLLTLFIGSTASMAQAQDTRLFLNDTGVHTSWSVDTNQVCITPTDPDEAYSHGYTYASTMGSP